jgi:hypothetical protein
LLCRLEFRPLDASAGSLGSEGFGEGFGEGTVEFAITFVQEKHDVVGPAARKVTHSLTALSSAQSPASATVQTN